MRFFTTIFIGLSIICGCSSSFDNSIDSDVVLKCESIIERSESGIKLMFKPFKTMKGEITLDMLNSDGLVDYFQSHDTKVTVPKFYNLYFKKINDRNGIYKNAPLQLVYNITVVADK